MIERFGPAGAVDLALLEDGPALLAADRTAVLPALAGAGAQVRRAALAVDEAGIDAVAADGRPRAVLVAGTGAGGAAAALLAALTGSACPVPLARASGPMLPGWVGPLDLVLAGSRSGRSPQTLAVVDEALRRGTRLVTVGPRRAALADRAEQHGVVHVPVMHEPSLPAGPSDVWALLVPLLITAASVGLLDLPQAELDQAAQLLDEAAQQFAPTRDSPDNPAKALAGEIAGSLPLVWGCGELSAAAAARFARALRKRARLPALSGALPEVVRQQLPVTTGPFGAGGVGFDPDDFFRDRVQDGGNPPIRAVLVREAREFPGVAPVASALPAVLARRGVDLREVPAPAGPRLAQLACLVALGDFASVYVALAMGMDLDVNSFDDELEEQAAR